MSIQKKSLIGNIAAAKKAIIATSVASSSPFATRVEGQAGLNTAKRGAGMPTAKRGAGMPTAKRGAGMPTAKRGAGMPTAKRGAGMPTAKKF